MSTDGTEAPVPLFTPLSIAQAMSVTGRSKRTIDRWIKGGRLRTVRLDGQTVLIEDDVLGHEKRMSDNRLRSQQVGPPTPPETAT